jgi:glycosyltransferase involved in cell wall biosynthesis
MTAEPRSRPPLLAVVVANYNNRPYVRQCLDSLVAQTYRPLEIIVHDDASDDSSPDIIRGYERDHPQLVKGIYSAANRGIARARQTAILASAGEYITTLDSDDYFGDAGKLEAEMGLILSRRTSSGEDVIAFSDVLRVDENGAPLRLWSRDENLLQGWILREILTRSCLIPRDFVMSRAACFEAGGYDPDLSTHEDWDLKIRLAARRPFVFTGRTGTSYRRRPQGLSSLPQGILTENLWRVFRKNLHLLPAGERDAAAAEFAAFMARRQERLEPPGRRG